MGMSIKAKLIYGCRYSELPEEILDEVDGMLDSDELDYASPWYDCPKDRWVVGVECPLNGETWATADQVIQSVYEEIPEILIRDDLELAMYVSPHVT